MNVDNFLKKVAYIDEIAIGNETKPCYRSKFDDSFITHVGMENSVKFLAKLEVTEQLTHGVGFSPKDNKWYGWSHRAIYGFTIGSTCKKGDCHYRAVNEQDEIEAAIRFWSDEFNTNIKAEKVKDGEIRVTWEYPEDVPNKKLRNQISGATWAYNPNNFGRGEWTAKTMEDAKIMAQDFNEGVS